MSMAKAKEEVFPEVERVLYTKAPLIEVVCQVRFPADLRLEKDPPAEFQQRVRDDFPILTRRTQAPVGGLPPEVARALESVPIPSGDTIWSFSTEDKGHTLELLKDKLTLISRKYERWETFSSTFKNALDALFELYSPPFLLRIGLRYRDLIQRSTLCLEDATWSELLQEHVLGELAVEGLGERAVEASRSLLLNLPENEAQVRLQHGLAHVEGESEQCYLIDCDFFVRRTETGDATKSIDYLHRNAARYFRWCITKRLHDAMDPVPIRD